MRKLGYIIAVLLIAGVVATAWLVTRDGAPPSWLPAPVAGLLAEPEQEGRGRRPVAVRLAQVEQGRADVTFETSGGVVAAEAVTLTGETAARVVEVLVEDGATVAKDEPILRFDASAQRVGLEAARAQLAEAEADLNRSRELRESGTVAEARVETALAAARRARADVQAAEEAVEARTVRAPFAGAVGFVELSPGAFLRPGDPIAELKTAGDLRVRFSLPIEAANAADDAKRIRIAGDAGECEALDIVATSPLTDPQTRTRDFEARLPEACSMRPGAFVTVSIVTRSRPDALLVPHAAVLREGFRSVVFVAEDNEDGMVARRVPVEVGPFSDDTIVVREGLEAGQRIVSSGLQKLSDGAPIRPAEGGSGGGSGG